MAGSWRSLPGSQTSWAGRAKVPRKATNLAFVAYAAACLERVLLGTPKPSSSCDSCRRISTPSFGRRAIVGAPADLPMVTLCYCNLGPKPRSMRSETIRFGVESCSYCKFAFFCSVTNRSRVPMSVFLYVSPLYQYIGVTDIQFCVGKFKFSATCSI